MDPRPMQGYLSGSNATWLSVLATCVPYANGTLSSSSAVSIGSKSYRGDLLEVVIWKGAELK
jgi:hypothetical protein